MLGAGRGVAFAGYSVDVPEDLEPGVYESEDAIILEAEALLGGSASF